jgi:hypothetical protein
VDAVPDRSPNETFEQRVTPPFVSAHNFNVDWKPLHKQIMKMYHI